MTQANDPSPRELWEKLGSYSTLHGFHFTFNKSSKVRRVVWTLLLIGAGVFLAMQIYRNILKVMAYEVVLKYRSETRALLDFPAVSICNNNMFRRSRINGTFAQRYLDLLDYQKSTEWPKLQNGLNYSLDLEAASLKYGHNLTEMMHNGSCEWSGRKTCNEQNFTMFFAPRNGLCYTYNPEKGRQEIVKTVQTGIFNGFAITLDAQPEEYYGPFSYRGTGFRVIIRDQNDQNNIDKDSLQIPPGFNVELRITRKEYMALEAPYPTRCITREGYSRSRCRLERYWNTTVQTCGCRMLGTVGKNFVKFPFCTPWQMRECVIKLDSGEVLPGIDHLCPRRCHQVEYDIQSSFMAFPSDSFWELLKTKYNMSKFSQDQRATFLKNYKSRFAHLTVYYGDNKVDIISEEPVYTTRDLANDVGGSMGLFLGCSLLTVMEFIDVFVLMCVARWNRRKQADVFIAKSLSYLADDLGGSMGLFLGCSLLTVMEFIDVLVLMCLSHWRRKKPVDVEANEQTSNKTPEWIRKSNEK